MSKKKAAAPVQDTLVTFLLDRTGSMASIKADTIGGFNAYLEGLQQATTPILFTFLQFDSRSLDKICVKVPVAQVKPLTDATFIPRDMTNLIDSAYETIKAVEASEESKTHKIIICIQTDGEENSSRKHNWEELNSLIKEKQEAGWQFNFMGAGIDAYKQASRMGISTANTMSYNSSDKAATFSAYTARASSHASFAMGRSTDTTISLNEKMAAGDKFDPALKTASKPSEPDPLKL